MTDMDAVGGFAVFRHPDVTVAGVIPAEAAEGQRHRGWYRVSEWRDLPAQLDPATFGADLPDLDAPEPTPEPEPTAKPATKKTKEQ